MVDQSALRLWTMRAAYVGLCLLIIFVQLMPHQTTPRWLPGPDLLLGLTFVWAVRRPEYVPALLIGAVALLADLMFQRPPGLWAALLLGGAETLKIQARGLRDQPFPMEWFSAAVVTVVVFLTYRLANAIFLVPQAGLQLSALQAAATILVYPLLVLVSHLLFGLRKSAPGEVDTLGHRL